MRVVKVWDSPTRIVHWALVALFALAWLTGEDEGVEYVVHTYAGYLILLLLLFRFAWGVAGNQRARFSDFVRPWAEVRAYAFKFLRLSPPEHIGHNPLGGWMIVAMLLGLSAVVVSGLIAAGAQPGALLGPLVPGFLGRIFEEIHEGIANFMLLLVLLHIFGVVMDWLLSGDNLIGAMVTGVKQVADDSPAADARGGSLVLAVPIALFCLAVGALMVWLTSFP